VRAVWYLLRAILEASSRLVRGGGVKVIVLIRQTKMLDGFA